ncbi:MAG: thioredoxin fold domain-containing protein [Bacteroidota bacterium]
MVKARNLSLLLLVTFLFSFTEPVKEVSWVTIKEAQEMVKSEPKAILIDFTAEWCGWCKVMDKKTFSDADVASYMSDNFYTVKLDYDSEEKFEFFGEEYTARQLGEKFRVPGLPTILLVTADNKKSQTIVGYKKPEPFLRYLKNFAD